MAIHNFARAITDGEAIRFFGDGSSARDYTYVDDIIAGVCLAMGVESGFAIYNLGGSATTTLSELVAHLERALGRKAVLNRLPDQPGDMPLTYADISLVVRDLGYSCTTPLAAGIDKFCAWYIAEKKQGRVL
jgi:UDP-glucuronate 4-epimerase